MAYFGEISPHYVMDAVNFATVRFLKCKDADCLRRKARTLEFRHLIHNFCYVWCKKQEKCMLLEDKKV